MDQFISNFKTIKELQIYANSQLKLINELNNKIKDLNSEIKVLKESSKLPVPTSTSIQVVSDLSNEMLTCLTQIKILKDRSDSMELTFEETKKLEIYTKLLQQLKQSDQKVIDVFDKVTSDDLFKFLDTPK